MSAKQHIHALPRYMSEYKRGGKSMYKYQRRVPVALQSFLGRKKWDLSLGGDLSEATDRALACRSRHDKLIVRLSTPEGRKAFDREVNSGVAADLAELTLLYEDAPKLAFDGTNYVFDDDISNASGTKLDGDRPDQELWRTTEQAMAQGATLPKRQERDHLALFSAYAFGDHSHLERLEANDAFGAKLVDILQPTRPTDITGAAIFDALKGALDARIFQLDGEIGADNQYCLGALRKKYCGLRNVAEHTRRGYISKTDSLIAVVGDLPLTHYTPEKLRAWRDELTKEGLSARSVTAYFTAVKAIMRWALKEELVPGFDNMPTDRVTMPRIDDSIEEIRWQRFDDPEIKKVWALLLDGWGETSRFAEARRETFKMVFRVLLYTGLRPVEVFRLRPENVTVDLIHAKKVKTGISRTMPLSKHIADFHAFMQRDPFPFKEFRKESSAAETMSESFTKIIRAGGFENSRHVLYSTKDTLVDRLQRAQYSDDIIRGFTGHVSGQGKLRHYKTRLNDSPEGLAILRSAIDSIAYW